MRPGDFERRGGPPYGGFGGRGGGPPFRGGRGGGGAAGFYRGAGVGGPGGGMDGYGPRGGGSIGAGPGVGGPPPPSRPVVDRTKTCPLLLRVFVKAGAHHRIEDFAKRGQEPEGCVHMYTWMDATLGELTELVQEVNDDARKPRTRLSFALIYPDRRGRNVMRQIGMVMVGRPSGDDEKTLAELSFQTGDVLDVALL